VSEFPWTEAADWLPTPDAQRYGALVTDQMVTVRRHRLEAARDWLLSGGSVLFFGPDEAGKTAALDVLVASVPGWRVLRCVPGQVGAATPYGAVAELLSSATARELRGLSEEHRTALDRLADGRPGRAPAVRAATVRRAVVSLVRSLSRERHTVLVIDDLQWVDEPSADVLRFAAAQVEELPVRMVAAERVTDRVLPRGRGLCPSPLLAVRLDALVP